MDRALPTLLVAVLLVVPAVSVPAFSAAGESTGPPLAGASADAANDSVTRLGVGGSTVAEGFSTPAPDVGTAVALGDREFRGHLLGYEWIERLREAESRTGNRTAFREALDDFQERVELLRDVEADAARAFYSGETDAGEVLQGIARVDAEAGAGEAALAHLRERARAIDGDAVTFSLRARSFSVARDFGSFETPIRDLINRTYRGDGEPTRVHVVASTDGLVLEAIHDGRYVRDAVRFDNYDPTEPPVIDRSRAIAMIFDRYPTLATNSSVNGPNQIAGRLWEVEIRYPDGETTVYLDRSTERVYREVHQLDLDDLPTTTVVENADGGAELVVNRTPQGNPYQVRVVDSITGEPIDATVSVAGERVGATGEDGVLWTLGTRDAFRISVETPRQTINATVGG